MLTLRLGARLLLASGREGAVRWILTALGIAIVVFAVILTWKIPQVVSAGVARAEARAPISAKVADSAFRQTTLQDALGGRARTRVLLTDVRDGVAPPPGLPRMPEPGELFRSPAWTEAEGVASGQIGVIAPDGLTDPDEYIEYVGVAGGDVTRGRPASGFGDPQHGTWVSVTTEKLMLIQFMLLAVPLGGYLLVATRLSAESRRRRMASLSLLGMDDAQVIKVSSLETVVHAASGALLGVAGFAAVAPLLGKVGWLGMRWFPHDVSLKLPEVVIISLIVVVAALVLSIRGSRRLLATPLSMGLDDSPGRLSWWRWLPLAVGLAILAGFVAFAEASSGRQSVSHGTVALLVGSGLTLVGLVLSSQALLRRAAAAVPSDGGPLSVRLAARRIGLLPGATARVLATLLLMVLAAALATAVLEDARAAVGPQGDTLTLFLTSESVGAADIAAAAAAGSPIAQATVASSRPTMDTPPMDVIWAECADASLIIGRDLPGCEADRSYRLQGGREEMAQWDDALPPVGVEIDLGGGATVAMPGQGIRVADWGTTALSPSTVLVTRSPQHADVSDLARTMVLIDNTPDGAATFLAGLREHVPDAAVDALGVNSEGFETYRVYRGVIVLGLAIGLMLGLGGYVLTSFDARRVSRRNTAALLATGVPRRTLQASQVWRDLLPLVGGLLLWGGAAVLIAFTYLEMSLAPSISKLHVLAVVTGAGGLSCIVATLGGLVLIESRVLTTSNLRRE